MAGQRYTRSSRSNIMFGVIASLGVAEAQAQTGVDFVETPQDSRVVTGADFTKYEFGLEEADGQIQMFDISSALAGGTITETIYDFGLNTVQTDGPTLNGQGLFANTPASLLVRPDFSGIAAGTGTSLVVTLTNQDAANPWTTSQSTVNFQVVDNRTFTGSATIDAGRHIVGQKIGELVISGGTGTSALHTHATDVTVINNRSRSTGTAFKTRVSTDSAFVFNDENQAYTLDISSGSAGTVNTSVDGSEFFSGLLSAEAIEGSSLSASGVTLDVMGTAVEDRQISSGVNHLGRFLKDSAPAISIPGATVSQSLTTTGSDLTRTRLSAAAQSLGTPGSDPIAATTAGGNFQGAGDVVLVDVTTTAQALDTSTIGLHDELTLDIALTGEGLAGETPQTSAQVGYAYNVVDFNTASASDVMVAVLKGTMSATLNNSSARRDHSTAAHTAITVNGGFGVSAAPQATSTASSGIVSSRIAQVTEEGLDGEENHTYVSPTYDVTTITINQSNLQLSGAANGDELQTGDQFTFTNNLRAADERQATADLTSSPQSFSEGLSLDVVSGGGSDLFAGDTITYEVVFNDPDLDGFDFGRKYSRTFDFTYIDKFDGSATHGLVGAGSTLQTYQFTATETIDSISDFGLTKLDAGYDFFGNELILTAETETTAGLKTLELGLLDSETLASGIIVQAQFKAQANLDSALSDAGTSGFDLLTTDAVELTGLDGIQHVLQLTATGGDDAVAWYDPDNDAWINAVLGNSNISDLDLAGGTLTVDGEGQLIDEYLEGMRFEGTYFEYLTSLDGALNPELGAFGVHADGSSVWAVIDHNSTFSVLVPEPTSLTLLGLGGLALLRRRNAG